MANLTAHSTYTRSLVQKSLGRARNIQLSLAVGGVRGGSLTRRLLAVVTVIVAAIIALAVALTIQPSSQTTESTSASQLSPSGLRLTLMTNATIIHSSQAIGAVATIFNTLTQNTTVYPNSTLYGYVADWGRYFVGPCPGFKESALSIAIFMGHYTVANFSSTANPLRLVPPQASGCPAFPRLKSLEFLPRNDTAEALYNDSVTGPQHLVLTLTQELNSGCATPSNKFSCTSTPGVKGYWPDYYGAIHYFDPGSYTIVAADSWGQTVYMYFVVV
jgi:hypothetical protein